ncbi:acyl carrier protein 2, chloroplastic-like [Helianthus annuus]|uniref:acyl carrier protein 2, chloroplastic-like n=1 Tax=Helianthus annuus TaxID=4232 RepID=UPI000B8F40C4|nr:acyl carrier protein 2, chloroplastic-like [Helianthus annuus]
MGWVVLLVTTLQRDNQKLSLVPLAVKVSVLLALWIECGAGRIAICGNCGCFHVPCSDEDVHRMWCRATSLCATPIFIHKATISNQLSIDECTIAPSTKFGDLGADSLDTVEIMMALDETFGVSTGESGAENIVTVQDVADLIEKVKAEA